MDTFSLKESNVLINEQSSLLLYEENISSLLNEMIIIESTTKHDILRVIGKTLSKAIDIIVEIISQISIFIKKAYSRIKKRFIVLLQEYKGAKEREVIFQDREFIWNNDEIPTVKEFEDIRVKNLNVTDRYQKFKQVNDTLLSMTNNKRPLNQKITFSLINATDFINSYEDILKDISNKLNKVKSILQSENEKLLNVKELPNDEAEDIRNTINSCLGKQAVYMRFKNLTDRAFSDQMYAFSLVMNQSLYPK